MLFGHTITRFRKRNLLVWNSFTKSACMCCVYAPHAMHVCVYICLSACVSGIHGSMGSTWKDTAKKRDHRRGERRCTRYNESWWKEAKGAARRGMERENDTGERTMEGAKNVRSGTHTCCIHATKGFCVLMVKPALHENGVRSLPTVRLSRSREQRLFALSHRNSTCPASEFEKNHTTWLDRRGIALLHVESCFYRQEIVNTRISANE